MNSFRKTTLILGCAALLSVLTACGGGSSGPAKVGQDGSQPGMTAPLPVNSGSASPPVPPAKIPVPVDEPVGDHAVALTGRITFDHVPFDSRRYKGLNYAATEALPARGVTVQLLDSDGNLLASTRTDTDGHYQFVTRKNTAVRVRVLAELASSDQGVWQIRVRDNTQSNAHYVLDGALASVGENPQQRDLHAPSGWTGEGYGEARSAAPFAVLDSIYAGLQTVLKVDPDVVLAPLDVYWSPKNIAMSGDLAKGEINTSFFTSAGPAIYLLGAADNDSDEYDRAVVQHEFAHYLEHELGRPESMGGSHNITTRLDLRVAFAEAWGNAFAAMASGDALYRDSMGLRQSSNFVIDVESTSFGRQGWFSEDTVQSILYDLFDDAADGKDTIAMGFGPIFSALVSDEFLQAPGVASIFTFAEILKRQNPELEEDIETLLSHAGISGRGWLAEGEKNSGQVTHALPVFTPLTLGKASEVCSDNAVQEYNGLGVRRLLAVTLPQHMRYTFTAKKAGGSLASANPQLRLLQQGQLIYASRGTSANVESFSRSLPAGNYVLEVYEEGNADRDTKTGGLSCFTVTVNGG